MDLVAFKENLISKLNLLLKSSIKEEIQLITDCRIYRLRILKTEEIKQTNPLLTEVKELLISAYVLSLEERLFLMQSMNATERYNYLITNFTCYFQQIPLTHIASFLGISLETLSRIRAKNTI